MPARGGLVSAVTRIPILLYCLRVLELESWRPGNDSSGDWRNVLSSPILKVQPQGTGV